jgi:hypothetical protein
VILDYIWNLISNFFASDFGSDYASGFLATLTAALFIFAWRELFSPIDLTGTFYVKSTIMESTLQAHRGLVIFHTLCLTSDGYVIDGSSEKTGEIELNGTERRYVGIHRRRGKLLGKIQRNYFKSSILSLHIEEINELREISIVLIFKLRKKSIENGKILTTAADSSGYSECSRQRFTEHPMPL